MTIFLKQLIKSISLLFFSLILFSSQTFAGVTFVDSFSVLSQESKPATLAFNNDGTKMYVAGNVGNDVNEYTLSTAFDVSTASYSQNFSVSSQDGEPFGITFNNDGTKMFIAGAVDDEIH